VIVATIAIGAIASAVCTFVSVYQKTGDGRIATACALIDGVITAWSIGLGFCGPAGIFLGIGFMITGKYSVDVCSAVPTVKPR